MISEFQGDCRWLSNFYPAKVTLDGVVYPTVEHAYQAAKTHNWIERKSILLADTPGKAKRLGGRATLREDWHEVKLSVMKGLVQQKFTDPTLRRLLLATGDEELVEGNRWNDTFWGVCNGTGLNHLGRIIMQVRFCAQRGL
jgi:ribA/ribD-fused uncharacterized protein